MILKQQFVVPLSASLAGEITCGRSAGADGRSCYRTTGFEQGLRRMAPKQRFKNHLRLDTANRS